MTHNIQVVKDMQRIRDAIIETEKKVEEFQKSISDLRMLYAQHVSRYPIGSVARVKTRGGKKVMKMLVRITAIEFMNWDDCIHIGHIIDRFGRLSPRFMRIYPENEVELLHPGEVFHDA